MSFEFKGNLEIRSKNSIEGLFLEKKFGHSNSPESIDWILKNGGRLKEVLEQMFREDLLSSFGNDDDKILSEIERRLAL